MRQFVSKWAGDSKVDMEQKSLRTSDDTKKILTRRRTLQILYFFCFLPRRGCDEWFAFFIRYGYSSTFYVKHKLTEDVKANRAPPHLTI